MMERILAALHEPEVWTKKLTRLTYEAAFKNYCEQYRPLFQSAVQNAESPEKLAESLMNALNTEWKRIRFWERGRLCAEQKLVVVTFLTPMLLSTGDLLCCKFAQELRDAWARSGKNGSYEIADYDSIKNGFQNRIFGIEIGKLRK